METSRGGELARLLHLGFTSMIEDVVVELDSQGHPGVTSTHAFALEAIDQGAHNAAELSRALGISRQAAAKTIVTLESLGYVTRRTDPTDARRKQLVVTARGFEMIRIGGGVLDKIRARWAKQVGAEQLGALEAALRTLVSSK